MTSAATAAASAAPPAVADALQAMLAAAIDLLKESAKSPALTPKRAARVRRCAGILWNVADGQNREATNARKRARM